MSRGRKKKKKGAGTIILLLLVIVLCSGVLIGLVSGKFQGGLKSVVAKKVTEQVMEQAIQEALERSGDSQAEAKAKEIVDSMDETDKEEAAAIVEKYADGETLSDLADIVGNGINSDFVDQVKEYLQENVSEEDIRKLQELYQKYEGTVP